MNNLTISKDVYFDCNKIQLKYPNKNFHEAKHEEDAYTHVNRYVIVREDTGKELGIHTDDYIIRPYAN